MEDSLGRLLAQLETVKRDTVLILVVMEDSLGQHFAVLFLKTADVLILVVMEDSLGQPTFDYSQPVD